MPNNNTVAAVYNSPAQVVNSTAETLLVNSATNKALTVAILPGTIVADSHTFRVQIQGQFTGGTGATAQLNLYLGTSLSGTKIAAFTVSASAVPASGSNFQVFAELTWDSVSGLVNGYAGGQTNNTRVAATTATTQVTAANAQALVFCGSVVFGAALPTNTISVKELSLTQV